MVEEAKRKLNVAVIFGSRSVEHEVSIVTALQLMENFDKEKYNVIPLYITKEGGWLTGEHLKQIESFKNLQLVDKIARGLQYVSLPQKVGSRELVLLNKSFFSKNIPIDIFFPALHGTFGEDGTIQGLFDMAKMPYVGCGVTAAALSMDKIAQKAVFEKEGLPVVNYFWFTREEWHDHQKQIIEAIEDRMPYPLFVKPASLGSSVGITQAKNRKTLTQAIEVAKELDRRIIIEEAVQNLVEINCSVFGFNHLEASVCEQPIKQGELLSYEDKYMRGGKGGKGKGMASLSRLIPAPISPQLTKKIQDMAKIAFRAIDASGVARIDFMMHKKTKRMYINEINTVPGSFAYYLWEKSGLPFPKLIDKLIDLGFKRFEDRFEKTLYSYDSKLLEAQTKGSKN